MSVMNSLFVEKYRPRTIAECILPVAIKKSFQEIVDNGEDNFPNMIFHGGPGTGKTTSAIALCNELNRDFLFINASNENGIDVLRTKITSYASTMSLDGGLRVVILDEADHLNPSSTQPALRGFIEEFSSNCRFILTCNYKNKIIPALQSRCPVIDFRIPKQEKQTLAGEMFVRVCSILDDEGITYERDVVAQTVKTFFPDLRLILGKVQQFSYNGNLDISVLQATKTNMDELFELLKDKQFNKVRKWVAENSDNDIHEFYSKIYEYIFRRYDNDNPVISKQTMAMAIPLIQQYNYEAAFTPDSQINMMAFLTMMMAETEIL